jgi:hypothetical protein
VARSSAAIVSAIVAFVAGCAAIGGLGDYKEVDCVGAACTDGGTSDPDGSSGGEGGELLDFVTVGGTLTGLTGKGLILVDNGADDLQVGKDGPFSFPAKVRTGDPYEVTVKAQPSEPTQACTVANGAGTANGVNVTNVAVTCSTSSFSVGGTVVGLSAGNVVLTNAGEELTVGMNGPFAFVNKVASGAAFDVGVKSGTCAVSGGTGTVGVADVNSVVVNCAPGTYTVGGSISGLNGTVVLQNNGANDTTLTSNGTFAFTTTLTPGQPYAISVKTQPGYPPRSQTCTVTGGSGTMPAANVTNVNIACTTNTFTVGGNAAGLSGTLVLKNNGGNDLTVTQSGAFTFTTPIASGSGYAVTIGTQPAGQTCSVAAGSGTVTSGAITNVSVSCSSGADPGVLCGGGTYCTPGTQTCCVSGGTGTCGSNCTGGADKVVCDSQQDCAAAGLTSHICCGAVIGSDAVNSFCTSATMCQMGSGKAFYCNPSAANPCPNGGTCAPASNNKPLPGYYRCF